MEGKVGCIIRKGVWRGEEEKDIRDGSVEGVREGGTWVAFRKSGKWMLDERKATAAKITVRVAEEKLSMKRRRRDCSAN